MARNGSGTYSLPLSDVVADTTILASWANTTLNDVATALTNSLAKNGETQPTANLPMNNYKHTGVGAATARTDYVRAAELQDGTHVRLSGVGGTGDNITATAPMSVSAYVSGQRFTFIAGAANTAATTININSLGAQSIKKGGTSNLVGGDIPVGSLVTIEYDGTNFQLLSPALSLGAAAASAGITFASGDSIVWRGAAVPTGWTLYNTIDNFAIRIMAANVNANANGGTANFSSVFTSRTPSGTNSSESANHTHSGTTSGPSTTVEVVAGTPGQGAGQAHTHTFTTGTQSANHTHTFTGVAMDFAVKYRDMNIIVKT